MTKSYRIRTSINSQGKSDSTIRVNIDQDFDFLEILSLKLTQSDAYRRFCSDYGVIVGRVVANGGFGIPNARVSVFVPVDTVDLENPIISTLYPYTSPTDRNEDGYRYNLLPYEPSYEGHVATGTFPTKDDVLNRKEVLEIYEKYYKYTVKTNESGDYMIVGVPLGDQKVVVDVDLSDMGCFSLRPTDLIRMNRANRQQFDGNNFRSSNELNSLPQIVNIVRAVNVGSFWGENDECNIGITRLDFDLRDQNINIEPTAVFMGSIFSSSDEDYLKNNCKPKSEQGDLCGLVTGPGTLLAVRQTVNLDQFGRPILEQHALPSGGKVIDENGAFVVDVPMNLDYLITDEYGNLVVSQDPTVGIPSKGKYRFKVKYNSSEKDIASLPNATQVVNQNFLNLNAFAPKGTVLRGNYLLPNIKEYGWDSGDDPTTKEGLTSTIQHEFNDNQIQEVWQFQAAVGTSLRFEQVSDLNSLQVQINGVVDNSKWIDIPPGSPPTTIRITVIKKTEVKQIGPVSVEIAKPVKVTLKVFDYDYAQFQRSYSFSLDWDDYPNYQDAIECRDIFYEFNYNKVYTPAQLIDEYRKGSNRARFLTIKEILERSCQTEVNKFPVNDGVRNFDLLYFIISILFSIISILAVILVPVFSLVKFLWNRFAVILALFFLAYCAYRITTSAFVIAALFNLAGPVPGAVFREIAEAIAWTGLFTVGAVYFRQITALRISPIKLPMITYPDCSACDCGEFEIGDAPPPGEFNTSPLADINTPAFYRPYGGEPDYVQSLINQGYGQVAAGRDDKDDDANESESRTPRYTFQNNEYWDSGDKKDPDSEPHDKSCNGLNRYTLPIPERINLYNTKGHYFDNQPGGGSNRIKVYPNYLKNGGTVSSLASAKFYEDQPLVFMCDSGFLEQYSAGTMLSFISSTNSKDFNFTATTVNTNGLGNFNVTGTTPSTSAFTVTIPYANPNDPNDLKSQTFTLQNSYTGQTSYAFPADIEYYQVVTGYSLNYIIQNFQNGQSGSLGGKSFTNRVIFGNMSIGWGFRDQDRELYIGYSSCKDGNGRTLTRPIIDAIQPDIRDNVSVMVLMKGVDPYSTRQKTKIDVSRIFGFDYGKLLCDADYKLNVPIKAGLVLPNYSNFTTNFGTGIFHDSFFFTPSVQTTTDKEWKFSAFTTTNQNLYGSYSSGNIVGGVPVVPNNDFVINTTDGYYTNEYVEGAGYMYRSDNRDVKVGKKSNGNDGKKAYVGRSVYSRGVYNPTGSTLNFNNASRIIMRTDRLPRSDGFDNNFVLAQNKNFSIYQIPDEGLNNLPVGSVSSFTDFSTGQSADFEEAYGSGNTNAISTFSCEKMVPIGAYEQSDNGKLQIKPEDTKDWKIYWFEEDRENKRMVKGCYQIGAGELKIGGDLRNFAEWKTRFLVGLAICRNVFGLTFTNQWINGTLYMPGFQNDKIFKGNLNVSEPEYIYCKEKLVFRIENNSFFYRSSPYNSRRGFVGMTNFTGRGNSYFLGNPTTIMDLGPKDNIIKNICPQPEFQGYTMGRMNPTSFNPVGDLLQLFVVSRLSNATWLNKMLSAGNASVGQFFTRVPGLDKIDGDFAQMASVNSEFGVVPFSPEAYSTETGSVFFNTSIETVVGVFFTGNTTNRDFISPGRESFIDTAKKYGFNQFGKKSQIVPMYKWKVNKTSEQITNAKAPIFGSEKNNWYTLRFGQSMFSTEYQNIDRILDNTYFPSPIKLPTTQRPGYIYASKVSYDVDGNPTGYTYDGFYSSNVNFEPFVVGAPYHFYFGLKIGKTALDKFITDYAIEI